MWRRCSVCFGPETPGELVCCVTCGIPVHRRCVGLANPTPQTVFQCDVCRFLAQSPIETGVSSRRRPAVLEVLLLHGAGRVFGAHERRESRFRAYFVRTIFAGRGNRGLRADDARAAGAAAAVQRAAHAEPAERAARRGRQLSPRLCEHVPALQSLPCVSSGRFI